MSGNVPDKAREYAKDLMRAKRERQGAPDYRKYQLTQAQAKLVQDLCEVAERQLFMPEHTNMEMRLAAMLALFNAAPQGIGVSVSTNGFPDPFFRGGEVKQQWVDGVLESAGQQDVRIRLPDGEIVPVRLAFIIDVVFDPEPLLGQLRMAIVQPGG